MDHMKGSYMYINDKYGIEQHIVIPFDGSVDELAHILMIKYDLPIYAGQDLINNLNDFINALSIEYFDNETTDLLTKAREYKINVEDVTREWENIMKEEITEYGECRCASDDELFAMAYHKMVHSPALETMLQLEHMYSKTVRQKTDEKKRFIQELSERGISKWKQKIFKHDHFFQTLHKKVNGIAQKYLETTKFNVPYLLELARYELKLRHPVDVDAFTFFRQSLEMNKAVDRLETDMTELKINELVARHYEAHSLLQGKLTSELDTIKEAQRREYREWLMQMLEQNQTNSSLPTPNSPWSPIPPEIVIPRALMDRGLIDAHILEESFTIHLGSQLKQMHNIRILSANVMDLCAIEDKSHELTEPTPQLLQTALALYSNDMSGLVLMADNKIGSRMTHEFQEICQRTTEFHFAHIEDQLDKISNVALQYLKSSNKNESKRANSELLQPGDFYMTRHSNLAQVHVIFHMVSDDSLRGCDINSRHPVVLGLRNILKTACSNDVTSLTIPLLLQYDMTEEMTISWCEKRAELVFKCVKGFMIEMASWGGSDLKNLQFMLPQGISNQVFHSLTEMLPRIFKVSNPKILK